MAACNKKSRAWTATTWSAVACLSLGLGYAGRSTVPHPDAVAAPARNDHAPRPSTTVRESPAPLPHVTVARALPTVDELSLAPAPTAPPLLAPARTAPPADARVEPGLAVDPLSLDPISVPVDATDAARTTPQSATAAISHITVLGADGDGWGATIGGRGGTETWRIDGDGVVPGGLQQQDQLAVFGGVAYGWQSGTTLSLVGGISLDNELSGREQGDPTRLLLLDGEPEPFVGLLLRANF